MQDKGRARLFAILRTGGAAIVRNHPICRRHPKNAARLSRNSLRVELLALLESRVKLSICGTRQSHWFVRLPNPVRFQA